MSRFYKPQSATPAKARADPESTNFSRGAWHAPFLDTGSHRHDGKAEDDLFNEFPRQNTRLSYHSSRVHFDWLVGPPWWLDP
jgi:hypothetical protein